MRGNYKRKSGEDMSNPWEKIDLEDYERHMCLDSVYQLQTLCEMMKEQFYSYDMKTIMILGVAGGNGLEHINADVFEKVYGVDVNQKYLEACRKRYAELNDVFEAIHADLLCDNLQLPSAELLVANLLIEYIGYECFQRVVEIVKPKQISCIIQINTGDSFVSDSPYLHAFDSLNEVHHQMEEKELISSLQDIGYKQELIKEQALPNGKKFVRLDFAKKMERNTFKKRGGICRIKCQFPTYR